ncbi:hypothetical protein [Nitrosomonas sp.]|uniref:hypothetical protein n=1 Tax=Nitrosomonas sp. TaxID=42353 RepID=UPI0037C51782
MKENFTYKKPSPEYRFFLYDREGEGFLFFRTEEERDAAASELIPAYLDETGWIEYVEDILTGCVTGHVIATDVEFVPLRSEFETDEAYQDAQDELSFYEVDGCDYRCNYRLADINDPGESTKRPEESTK